MKLNYFNVLTTLALIASNLKAYSNISNDNNLPAVSKVTHYNTRNLSVGLSSMYRSYSEELKKPAKSDEYGSLGGFFITSEIPFKQISEQIYFQPYLSYHRGTTTYDGSLQNTKTGAYAGETKGKTFNHILDTYLNLGWKLPTTTSPFSIIPYTTLGYHKWSRLGDNGNSTQNPEDYDEYYSWYYFGFGTKGKIPLNNSCSLEFDLALRHMILGHMSITNQGPSNKDHGSVNLGNELHSFASVSFNVLLNKDLSLQVSPYLESRPIGKSNINTTYGYYEPSSTTYAGGAKVALNWLI